MGLRLGFLTHLHVGEDAAVADTISGGRLQLGLGTDGDPRTFAAFGRDLNSRRDRFADGPDLPGPPGHPTPDQILTALERIASEVAPALGWRNQRTP